MYTKKSRQRFKVLSPILRAIPSAAIALAALLVGNGVAAGPVEDQIRRISTSLQDGTGSSPFPGFEFDAASLLADLYARRDHVPAWHGSRNAEELFTELNRGLAQGFLPGDFNLPLLHDLQDRAGSGDPADIAVFDVVATHAAIRLVHHLVFGKVDPAALDDAWNLERPVFERDPAEVLNAALELALFDLLLKDNLDKTSRERVKQASRDLLASIKTRLAELDRFWEKEQTKADVEVFILDEVFAGLPTPPFTPDEKKALATSVYAHVWQQAVNGGFAQAA